MKHKVQGVVEEHALSYTAKYWGFYGHHWHEGLKCWLVGTVSTETGITTARHYNAKESVNEEAARAEARKVWDELRQGLERAPTAEERACDAELLDVWEEARRRSELKNAGLPEFKLPN